MPEMRDSVISRHDTAASQTSSGRVIVLPGYVCSCSPWLSKRAASQLVLGRAALPGAENCTRDGIEDCVFQRPCWQGTPCLLLFRLTSFGGTWDSDNALCVCPTVDLERPLGNIFHQVSPALFLSCARDCLLLGAKGWRGGFWSKQEPASGGVLQSSVSCQHCCAVPSTTERREVTPYSCKGSNLRGATRNLEDKIRIQKGVG